MNKTIVFFLLTWIFCTAGLAQDKIITIRQDTIMCRIVSVSGSHIVYEQNAENEYVIGKTISLGDVAEYYRDSQVSEVYRLKKRSSWIPEKRWLLSLSAGGAYFPWLLENAAPEYSENEDYKKLSKGLALNATIHYLITGFVGAGIQYSFCTSGYESNSPLMIESFYPIYSTSYVYERQYINYAALSFVFRQFLDRNRKFSFNETLSGGLLLYRIEDQNSLFLPYYGSGIHYGSPPLQKVRQNTLITGNTFGATVGISAEYKLLPYLSIGIGGNFMYGNLSKMNNEYKNSMGEERKIIDQELANFLKVSRIDYSLVLRFNL